MSIFLVIIGISIWVTLLIFGLITVVYLDKIQRYLIKINNNICRSNINDNSMDFIVDKFLMGYKQREIIRNRSL